jgi:hypothetical protein
MRVIENASIFAGCSVFCVSDIFLGWTVATFGSSNVVDGEEDALSVSTGLEQPRLRKISPMQLVQTLLDIVFFMIAVREM